MLCQLWVSRSLRAQQLHPSTDWLPVAAHAMMLDLLKGCFCSWFVVEVAAAAAAALHGLLLIRASAYGSFTAAAVQQQLFSSDSSSGISDVSAAQQQ